MIKVKKKIRKNTKFRFFLISYRKTPTSLVSDKIQRLAVAKSGIEFTFTHYCWQNHFSILETEGVVVNFTYRGMATGTKNTYIAGI